MIVERNHLEWRLDPTSHTALPEAAPGRPVIVVCNEGYASSLAAVTLRSSAWPAPPTSTAAIAPGSPGHARHSNPIQEGHLQ